MYEKIQKGYTLIELLVVAGIIASTIGFTIAGYGAFNKSQKVRQAALTVKNNLRLAQSKAISAQNPGIAGCDDLVGYEAYRTSDTTYAIRVVCNTASPITTADVNSFTLQEGVEFTGNWSLIFYPLTSGVDAAEVIGLELPGTTYTGSVTVEMSGDMKVT